MASRVSYNLGGKIFQVAMLSALFGFVWACVVTHTNPITLVTGMLGSSDSSANKKKRKDPVAVAPGPKLANLRHDRRSG